ncbi:uncharacterized protein LOC107274019 isoform X2 [Cephus cinctus]|uniref:Uncharacterized protein LOC107274019 isoform X2 n=1 Tax=Cephus cinctus TaxID=211228 RepID=A0AAJ7CDQ5_CEPCN|nr:uncharacterized protein LOC107274019 isoform X2 [Cephus cinctus]
MFNKMNKSNRNYSRTIDPSSVCSEACVRLEETLSSTSSTSSLSNESFCEFEQQKEEYSDESESDCLRVNHLPSSGRESKSLILHFRNYPEGAELKSDDEKSEKLSEVLEEPEDRFVSEWSSNSEDHSNPLRERIETLKGTVAKLSDELSEEVRLWRKERQGFELLRERSDILVMGEVTAAAREAAEAYAAESPLSDNISDLFGINSEHTLSELTILEYEKKLAKYQNALAQAQAEKRYEMRRRLVANAYRQKLVEVERLCNEELERIRENASSLRPLNEMISRWQENGKNEGNRGDHMLVPKIHPTLLSPAEDEIYRKDDVGEREESKNSHSGDFFNLQKANHFSWGTLSIFHSGL